MTITQPGALQAEVRAVRRQLEQREEALAVLNRRLLQLERGDNALAGMQRADGRVGYQAPKSQIRELQLNLERLQTELEAARQANGTLQQELEALRATKLFRWAAPARKAYHLVRRLG